MDITVVGAGSLGSLLGGLLAREHDVTLVGRQPHVDTVAESGLRITNAIEATVEPRAVETPESGAATDLALITVKAFDTDGAVETLADVDVDVVCSLQNGLGNEATLAEGLDATVLAGTCTYGARLAEPGVVECTGVGEVALGPRGGGSSQAAEGVGEAFEAAGVLTTVAADMPRRLWEKLAVNAGVNAVTALARVPNGAVVDGPGSEPARDAARETARVARQEGIEVESDRAVAAVESVAEATAANTSSMLQDVEGGRRTEVDAINGAVAERGEADAPVNETLAALIRAWERGQGLR
ncbi:MAG: 2-dehydropantoate 2-reductase [Haloarculaceae archaeon]